MGIPLGAILRELDRRNISFAYDDEPSVSQIKNFIRFIKRIADRYRGGKLQFKDSGERNRFYEKLKSEILRQAKMDLGNFGIEIVKDGLRKMQISGSLDVDGAMIFHGLTFIYFEFEKIVKAMEKYK